MDPEMQSYELLMQGTISILPGSPALQADALASEPPGKLKCFSSN